MKRYLLDAPLVSAYLQGRPGALALIDPWLIQDEVTSASLVYGEVLEYFQALPNYAHRQMLTRRFFHRLKPQPITYAILERYATLRRALRPPHGPGLIGDVDTLIAATALEHTLTVVTLDGDYQRVPGISLNLLTLAQLRHAP